MVDSCKDTILAALANIERAQKVLGVARKQEQEVFARETLAIAIALREKRNEYTVDQDFQQYLKSNGLTEKLSHQDRAALINMGRYLDLAKKTLAVTERRSWERVWREEIKPVVDMPSTEVRRFTHARKPVETSKLPELKVIPIKPKFPIPIDIEDQINRHMKTMMGASAELVILMDHHGNGIIPMMLQEMYQGLQAHRKEVTQLMEDIKKVIPDPTEPLPVCHIVEAEYEAFRKKLQGK
jgi:hypothetical protein